MGFVPEAGDGGLFGMHAASLLVPTLEHADLQARPGQVGGRAEAVVASSDYHRVVASVRHGSTSVRSAKGRGRPRWRSRPRSGALPRPGGSGAPSLPAGASSGCGRGTGRTAFSALSARAGGLAGAPPGGSSPPAAAASAPGTGRLSRRPAADARRPRWRSRRRGTPPSPTCRSRRPSSPAVRAAAGPAAAYPRTPPGPAPGIAARSRPGRSPLRPPGGRRRPGGPPPASPPPSVQPVVFRDRLEGVVGGGEGDEAVRVLGGAAHVEVGDRRAVLRQLLEGALVQQVVD